MAVSVVIVGTVGVVLIFKVLVALALLKLVIVPELDKFTIPAALFVIPAIVPDPLRLTVPVLVKFASAVLIAPEPDTLVVPELVNVVIEQVPPIFKVPVAAFVNPPVPARAVPTVNVLLLVNMKPVTVILGMLKIPIRA